MKDNNNLFGGNNIVFDITHNKMYSKVGDNFVSDMQSGDVHTFLGDDKVRYDVRTGKTYTKINDHMWMDIQTGEITTLL